MNVLILTDFSEVSDNTGKYALDYLAGRPGNVYVLNIQDFNFSKTDPVALEKKMLYISKQLHHSLGMLKSHSQSAGQEFHSILSSENLISAIRKCIAEKKIDLIFIGAASQDVRHHPILGNHAYEVVRKIKCNIVAVPGKSVYRKPETSILPIDYSVLSKEKTFRLIEECDFIKDSRITVLEMNEALPLEAYKDSIQETLPTNLKKTTVDYVDIEASTIFDRDLLMEIQDKFDIIAIIGKNLNVCDKLLHDRYGLCSKVDNSLPILVLHE
ncbi:universal stress protein [Salegentibacter sp. F188]|uniref:Universal stress protein n=1 Tax=Autumnicola patrickiae TaxID=3075591 RepID=A0ABU3E056_9FLAO|nr:universal stress protein [Salegentibacter sp. F188]MDT0689263.1 universal stress protein [Salegentibacter sp. F188]